MTEQEYGALPGITASAIKAGRTSMRHMRHAMTRARGEAGSPAMRWGTLAHMAILEPQRFLYGAAVWSGARRAGREWDAWQDANAGKTHVTQDELDQLQAMQQAIRRNKDAARLIADCDAFERPIQWDGGDGIGPCKARIDGCGGGYMGATGACGGLLIEYKTCREIGKDGSKFVRAAEGMGYSHQLAWYCGSRIAMCASVPHRMAGEPASPRARCISWRMCAMLVRPALTALAVIPGNAPYSCSVMSCTTSMSCSLSV
jgi:hypothetical protein